MGGFAWFFDFCGYYCRGDPMDFAKLPIGFAMALAQNEAAMQRYALMPEPEKQAVLGKARGARSEREMNQIVSGIAGSTMDG